MRKKGRKEVDKYDRGGMKAENRRGREGMKAHKCRREKRECTCR